MVTINKNRLKRLESKINDNSMVFTEVENKLITDIIERYTSEDLDISVNLCCDVLSEFIHSKYIKDSEIEAYKKIRIKELKIHESRKSKNNDRENEALKGMFDNDEDRALFLKAYEISKALSVEHSGELLELYKQGKIKELYALKDGLWLLAKDRAKLI
jgi:hypothetical protein